MPIARVKGDVDKVREEHPDEHYATPASLAVQFTRYLLYNPYFYLFDHSKLPIGAIHDPGVGDYPAFGYAVNKVVGLDVVLEGSDVRDIPQHDIYHRIHRKSFLECTFLSDYIIYGNPPFKVARSIVERSRSPYCSAKATVLLLRHAFWESRDRYRDFFSKGFMPHYVFPLSRRVPWWLYNTQHKGKKKTNTTQYAFFVWLWHEPPAEFARTIPFMWDFDPIIEEEYKKLYVKED